MSGLESRRPKKILYLAHGGSTGGGQTQLLYLIGRLNRHLYEPVVVCPKDGRFATLLRKMGVEVFVYPLRPWRKFPRAILRYYDAYRLRLYASVRRVSLVHCSDLWLSGYMRWLAAGLQIPAVLHIRTPLDRRDIKKHRCDKADVVIAISRRVRNDLIEAGICEDKIVQIDDGVDIHRFRPELKDVLGQDYPVRKSIRVGIVGRLCSAKRQMEFLRAAEIVKKTVNRKISFFVIGSCDSKRYYNSLRAFVKTCKLEDSVFFTGERLDMPEVLASLDILVSLSGGSVMFEAMACGAAVISAGFTPYKDSVHIQDGRTGLVIPSQHAEDLAAAIKRLVESDGLRDEITRTARKWVEGHLDCRMMVHKTQQVYEQLL